MEERSWKTACPPGGTGSEGGIVLEDEEYGGVCRITRERCEKYDAVTCGVYGDMVHTAFAHFDKSEALYDSMKRELQEFIDHWTDDIGKRSEFYKYFTNKYF